MDTARIRIKDIAQRAGVSSGTVDRVLHNRPNVSKASREKVEAALAEMDYTPNAYASALAYNRSYTFYFVIPRHKSEVYWEEIEEGAADCQKKHADFNVRVKMVYYQRFSHITFQSAAEKILNDTPDGVVIVPTDIEQTKLLTDELHERNIPFILLDSYLPDLNPLAFYGQDSFSSGYFAARMLMLIASDEKEIMLMKQMYNGNVASKQQENRETGFRQYMTEHFPQVNIIEVNLPLDEERQNYAAILENFFVEHPDVHHCITFNSKAHIVGEFLKRTGRLGVQIMGYDMVQKNAECVKHGTISFLIAQHAYMQGYYCVNTLFESVVLNKEVNSVNYMPIEILTKENLDFYRRKQR